MIKQIAGYKVESTPCEDREGVDIFVSRNGYSASLCKVVHEGTLENNQGREINISRKALELIEDYAESVGY